jgi:hypothetical protein
MGIEIPEFNPFLKSKQRQIVVQKKYRGAALTIPWLNRRRSVLGLSLEYN